MRSDPYASWADHDYAIERPRRREQPQFESAEGLSKIVGALLAITIVIYVVEFGLVFASILFQSETARAPSSYVAAQILLAVASLLTAICFIAWMFRCHQNLKLLQARTLQCKSSAAIWSWFVPLLNFFGPYQVMQEIWRGSDPKTAHAKGLSRKIKQDNSMLVRVWWGLWVTTLLLDLDKLLLPALIADQFRAFRKVELSHNLISILEELSPLFTGGQIASWFLSPACAVVAIVMVRRITENQERRLVMIEREERTVLARARLEDPEELEVISESPTNAPLDD